MNNQNDQQQIQNIPSYSDALKPTLQRYELNKTLKYSVIAGLLVIGLLIWMNIKLTKQLNEPITMPNKADNTSQSKELVLNETQTNQIPMKRFTKQIGLPITFSFPDSYMVAGTDQGGVLNIFIDKEPILFSEGDVMPGIIQIRYSREGSDYNISYDQSVKNTLAGLVSSSVEIQELKSVDGKIIRGVLSPGYMEGLTSITAVVNADNKPVTFSYISDTNKDSTGNIEKDFYKIIESIQAL